MNRPHTHSPRWRRIVAGSLSAAVVSVAGCAFDPASVPVPGTGMPGSSYPLRIEFANTLNLPARAKVMANGARVGTVEEVEVVDAADGGFVAVTVAISDEVTIAADTVAQLRQDTVLGDIHVELSTPPSSTAPNLSPGATLPRTQTRPANQIEDTLATISTFVQGGSITRFQDIVERLNAVFPEDPVETARISQVIGSDIQDLAANLDQADVFLNSLVDASNIVGSRSDTLAELLTESAVVQVSDSVASIVNVVGVLGALGAVSHSLVWLQPLVTSADAAAKAFVPLAFTSRPLDLSAPSNLNALVSLIRDRIIPFVERGPKVDIVGATITTDPDAPSEDDQVQAIVSALRMIGAVR